LLNCHYGVRGAAEGFQTQAEELFRQGGVGEAEARDGLRIKLHHFLDKLPQEVPFKLAMRFVVANQGISKGNCFGGVHVQDLSPHRAEFRQRIILFRILGVVRLVVTGYRHH
jgi:hypothetical protein